jgi:hypothetical protein
MKNRFKMKSLALAVAATQLGLLEVAPAIQNEVTCPGSCGHPVGIA